jgi:hypothetical protein
MEAGNGNPESRGSQGGLTMKTWLSAGMAIVLAAAPAAAVDKRLQDRSGLYAVEIGGRWGFMNALGTIEIAPRFEETGFFSEGAAAVKTGGKWGYIDLKGNILIPARFDFADAFSEGLAPALEGDRMGYVDKAGAWAVPPGYEAAFSYNEGRGRVQKGGLWGFLDGKGRPVIPLRYEDAGDFAEGAAPVCGDGTWGFIDKNGAPVFKAKFQEAEEFREGWARVNRDGLDNFVDRTGRLMFKDPKFLQVQGFSEGLAVVLAPENGKHGYIDTKGTLAVRPAYDFAFVFHEGLAGVSRSGRYGFIDKAGTEVVPLRYDFVDAFIGGLARVKSQDRSIYIDRKGNAVEPKPDQGAAAAAPGPKILIHYDMAGLTEVLIKDERMELVGSVPRGGGDPSAAAGPDDFIRKREPISVAAEDVNALVLLIREAGFFKLQETCGVPNPEERHYPVRITVETPDGKKSVLYRSHPNFPAPPAFGRAEEAILKFASDYQRKKK